ncbi:hypothetical protein AQUCO_01100541v1 [Aquilegia coerulea]|uniref:Nudix hydrolase domain-containing protein n=1 Tax=Aquilegia coerulea TaxID=218851 RepID=A0A2G5E860_AQUCA|nr:hypothetical protein AQUCO_01100541v1 [Aquilegia coerulea]
MASKLFLCNSTFCTKFSKQSSSNNFKFPSSLSFKVRNTSSTTNSFNWEDVLSICQPDSNDVQDLQPLFERIKPCNRGSEKKSEFFPFVVEEQIIGYIHKEFAENLRQYKDVFTFLGSNDGVYVTLHASLETPDNRTEAIGYVIKSLGDGLIPDVRNELYPVKLSYGTPLYFSLERAAAPYFGIKTYGVLMNGYVERDGEKHLWISKRSDVKPTYPGMLDLLVAGGIPHNMTCKENIIKECQEEAGIPESISKAAAPVGAVSYMDISGYCYKREVLFCHDIKLTDGFIPNNQDGEVQSFKLIPINHVANIIHKTEFFNPTNALGIIDFLFRHGLIRPEQLGYLGLLQSLKSGDFS